MSYFCKAIMSYCGSLDLTKGGGNFGEDDDIKRSKKNKYYAASEREEAFAKRGKSTT